jgi:hypothetical protein
MHSLKNAASWASSVPATTSARLIAVYLPPAHLALLRRIQRRGSPSQLTQSPRIMGLYLRWCERFARADRVSPGEVRPGGEWVHGVASALAR